MEKKVEVSNFSFPTIDDVKKNWFVFGGLALVAVGGAYYFINRNRGSSLKKDDSWKQPYILSTEKLKDIIPNFHSEMNKGLERNTGSTLKMLPSYVTKPTGEEKGTFLALDLGGTNFRVIKIELKGGKVIGEGTKKQYVISEAAMKGTHDELFGFIAECVKSFIISENITTEAKVLLGFTFSFPVNQTGVASGTLIQWTKGFTTTGVEGRDVVSLLSEAFARNHVNAIIVALANDTVGTMVARGYQDTNCEMGVILGTGSNACYSESLSNITKLDYGANHKGKMIINMEWGGFGDHTNFLPITSEDKLLDVNSVNPSRQIFEKMISGMYLGEITRYILLSLIQSGHLGNGFASSELLRMQYRFETATMTDIMNDKSSDLSTARKVLEDRLAVVSTLEERYLVKEVCILVSTRAARLSAMAIVAVLMKIGRLNDVTVAVDGGVFEHLPNFSGIMDQTIKELKPNSSVKLVLTKDGSGNGAAIIASTLAVNYA